MSKTKKNDLPSLPPPLRAHGATGRTTISLGQLDADAIHQLAALMTKRAGYKVQYSAAFRAAIMDALAREERAAKGR